MPATGDPGSDPSKHVQPPRATNTDLTEVAESVGPVGGVITCSGHVIHPRIALLRILLGHKIMQSVLRSWLGD